MKLTKEQLLDAVNQLRCCIDKHGGGGGGRASVGSTGSIKPWVYDTSGKEVVIGVYNGKPIYRKYFEMSVTCEKGGEASYALSNYVSSVEKVIDYNAYTCTGNRYPFLYAKDAPTYSHFERSVVIVHTTDEIRFTVGPLVDGVTNEIVSIFVEYTKTTDEAGSGDSLALLCTASIDYSLKEKVIGTWINGKPVYQKTLFYENYALTKGLNYLPFDIDIETIVDVKAFQTNSTHTNVRPINTYTFDETSESGANSLYYTIGLNDKNICLRAATAWSSPNIYFTLQYTKTTDDEVTDMTYPSAGGISNVSDYSTEEQRVGTWIDGKPLYQKTIGPIEVSEDRTTHSIADINYDTIMINGSASFMTRAGAVFPLMHLGLSDPIDGKCQLDPGYLQHVYISNKTLTFRKGNTIGTYAAYITIRYTKVMT